MKERKRIERKGENEVKRQKERQGTGNNHEMKKSLEIICTKRREETNAGNRILKENL